MVQLLALHSKFQGFVSWITQLSKQSFACSVLYVLTQSQILSLSALLPLQAGPVPLEMP